MPELEKLRTSHTFQVIERDRKCMVAKFHYGPVNFSENTPVFANLPIICAAKLPVISGHIGNCWKLR